MFLIEIIEIRDSDKPISPACCQCRILPYTIFASALSHLIVNVPRDGASFYHFPWEAISQLNKAHCQDAFF